MKKLFGKLMSRLVLFALLVGTNCSVFSQPQKPLPDNIPVIQSPQVWSFMKYGNMSSVDLYTGTVATSIPIYTYKDSDFEIPISINYASSGFVPNVPTGILGLGWYLNAGGCITREVRGIPDERQYDYEGKKYNGYLKHHKYDTESSEDWKVAAANTHPLSSFKGHSDKDRRIETLTDIYQFKFGKYKGSFCLGPDKKVYVYNTNEPFGEFDVEIDCEYGSTAKINITTGDGYKYIFGGATDNHYMLDYRTDRNILSVNYSKSERQVNYTWLLRKIIAPNNRNVEFIYSDTIQYETVRPHLYLENRAISDNIGVGGSDNGDYLFMIFTKQSGMRISSISVDGDQIIQFEYDDNLRKEKYMKYNASTNKGSGETAELRNMGFLSRMLVKSKSPCSDMIMQCQFCYNETISNEGNPMTFLKELKINNEVPYKFSYYNENAVFPYHGTTSIDHWGYYNKYRSLYDMNNLCPSSSLDSLVFGRINMDYREPNFDGTIYGMLKRITYPTGGYTTYKYESNTYSQKVWKNAESKGLPQLMTANIGGYPYAKHSGLNYIAGGVRIAEICDYSCNEMIENIKRYEYDINGVSSGILLHYPMYSMRCEYKHPTGKITMLKRFSGDLYAHCLDKYYIEYGAIKEILSNKSFRCYKYYTYYDYPDEMPSEFYDIIGTPIYSFIPENLNNYFTKPVSRQSRRGKIKQIESFGEDSICVKKTQYTYNPISDNYSTGMDVAVTDAYIYKTDVSVYPISEECQIDYCDSDSVVVTKTYKYNSPGQLIGQKISDGDRFKSNYTYYPTDVPSTSIIDTMIARNMVRYPVMEFTTLGRKSTIDIMDNGIINLIKHEDIIDAYKREYKMNAHQNIQYPVLSSILKAVIAAPVSMNKTLPELDYKTYQSFDVYDKYGNVVQTTSQDNIKTVYIWGYNGRYPIAIIENAVLDAIQQIEGLSDIEFTPLEMELSSNQENALRSLPYAHVTTYTYKPLIGIESITDPSGRRKSYDYDSSGRLVAIKDEDGIILEKFDYQYKNQNQNEQ